MRDREEEARRLIEHSLRIARRLAPGREIPVDELESAALVGLAKAINTFDPSQGASLKTWATTRVRGECLDATRCWARKGLRARTMVDGVRLGDLWETRWAYGVEAAASVHRSTPERVRALTERALQVSLHQPLRDGDVLGDLLEAEPERDLENLDHLWTRLAELVPERDLVVLYLRFAEELTMWEVGERLGISESRVSQLTARYPTCGSTSRTCGPSWRSATSRWRTPRERRRGDVRFRRPGGAREPRPRAVGRGSARERRGGGGPAPGVPGLRRHGDRGRSLRARVLGLPRGVGPCAEDGLGPD